MRRALTTLLALALIGALAAPAAAAPKKNPKSPGETASYWTSERMNNAKPRERAKPGGAGGGGRTSDWSGSAVPTPFTADTRKNGKVFFTLGGANYVCSGTAVDATTGGVNLVWTAGHCVADSATKYATNFMFVPAYDRGAEPYGRWTFDELASTPGWEAQGTNKWRYDVGAARVIPADAKASSFGSLQNAVGTRTPAFGQNPAGQRIVSYGYPAAGKFNGQSQFQCSSPFRRWDTVTMLDPMQISCDMTGGSSGGAWVFDVNGTAAGDGGGPLISVNSYGYTGEKNTMYGPFMTSVAPDNQAQQLYNAMK